MPKKRRFWCDKFHYFANGFSQTLLYLASMQMSSIQKAAGRASAGGRHGRTKSLGPFSVADITTIYSHFVQHFGVIFYRTRSDILLHNY
jgi:hypothetical protein